MSNIENMFDFSFSSKDYPSVEIIDYLEKKLREKTEEYEKTIAEKEQVIKNLNRKIDELNSFINELKESHSKAEEELLDHNRELVLKIEESKNLLLKQKEKHQKEISLLKSIFDKTRKDIEGLSKELEELKGERKRLKRENDELLSTKLEYENKISSINNQLAEAKKAVEQTVSELFAERKKVDELNKKLFEFEKLNEDLKKQIESLKTAWDNERQQWKEMWERERSMWEAHRMEFAVWEERLRNEREAWLKILKEEENKGVENARKLAQILEESSKWSYKVGELLKLYASKEISLPHILTSTKTLEKKVKKGIRRFALFAFLTILFISSGLYITHDYSNKIHLSLLNSIILDENRYSSFVRRGEEYLFTHPEKGIVVKNQKMETIDVVNELGGIRIKPSIIALEGDFVWVFDLSSLRFIKFDPLTKKVITSIKSLSFAPNGLVSDGSYLWTFDGIGGVLQRYELNGEIKAVKTYELDGIKSVDSISWLANNLIVLSNSRLYRFRFENNRFIKMSTQNMKNFVYCYLYMDEMYVLKDFVSAKKLEVYKIKNKERI